MAATVYLSRTGLLVPLGQSQIIGYLRGLSKHHEITLVTCERPEDLADQSAVGKVRTDCEAHGIDWHPLTLRTRPKVLAQIWTMVALFLCGLRAVRKQEARLLHARSYLPAAVAWLIWRLTGVPYVFDMRGLWLEELITSGRLKRDSWMHRRLIAWERRCLRDAAAVVSLTRAAVPHLRQTYPDETVGKPIDVIPTCTDLERFRPIDGPKHDRIYGCIGSVLSGWFRIDRLNQLFAAAAMHDAAVRFEVITRDAPVDVRRALPDVPQDRLAVRALTYAEMPNAIRAHCVSIMLYAGGEPSELARAPTRLAEILGCGVPVVASPGVGDVAAILAESSTGILLDDERDMRSAVCALSELLRDPDLPERCRQTAQAHFSIEYGTRAYNDIYKRILQRSGNG